MTLPPLPERGRLARQDNCGRDARAPGLSCEQRLSNILPKRQLLLGTADEAIPPMAAIFDVVLDGPML
jgi:hypothetical protein